MMRNVGDKVKVRSWYAMEREYGVDEFGNINIPSHKFLTTMIDFCDKEVTISELVNENGTIFYKIEEDNGDNIWADEMFLPYNFKYGDEILVSCDDEIYDKAIYICYIDGEKYPYAAVLKADNYNYDAFKNGKLFEVDFFPYAKSTSDDLYEVIIDGNTHYVNEEKYNQIMNIING